MIAKKSEIKKNKTNDFAALQELLTGADNTKLPSVAIAESSGSARDAVLKLMSDFKGRSHDEIVRAAGKLGYSEEAVSSAVRLLDVSGYFNNTKGTGKVIHTLKTGAAMGIKPIRKTIKPFRLPDQAIINPIGQINRSDDQDLAIWKATSDYKARTATQIAEILGEFGFDRQAIKDRTIVLMRRGWFVRKERSNLAFYTLRTEIKMPESRESVQMPEPNTGREELVTTYRPQDHEPIVALQDETNNICEPQQEIVEEKETTGAKNENIALVQGDSIHLMIWKVMCDYRPYTSADVSLLLSDMGVPTSSVYSMMSQLNKKGWFEREEAGIQPRFTYTLKHSIPMPLGAPLDISQENTTNTEEGTTMTRAATATTKEPLTQVQKQPLIEVVIKIKGQIFSDEEVKQLGNELAMLGYGHGVFRKPTRSLVSTAITIKGVSFTGEELEDLMDHLKSKKMV